MAPSSALGYYQHGRNSNQLLPMDLMIQIFMHLCQQPQDLLHCALTTRHWSRPALQELYRHPWTYLFCYQFDTEGRVMDKHGSMLLLRTLFQGCMDPTRTTFPYASFARSVNLKWVHDTFDLPEVDIQTLTGFRWTRNEAPKDFLIRHLLANRPYLNDFVHCHAPRLPRCLFAHMTTATINNFADEAVGEGSNTSTALIADGAAAEGSISGLEPANTINTANTASTDSDDWANMMQQVTDDDFLTGLDVSLLATPPLLPVQQPIATAMPLLHTVAAGSGSLDSDQHNGQEQNSEIDLNVMLPSPIVLPAFESSSEIIQPLDLGEEAAEAAGESPAMTGMEGQAEEGIIEAMDGETEMISVLEPALVPIQTGATPLLASANSPSPPALSELSASNSLLATTATPMLPIPAEPLSLLPMATDMPLHPLEAELTNAPEIAQAFIESDAELEASGSQLGVSASASNLSAPPLPLPTAAEIPPAYGFQQAFVPTFTHLHSHSRATTSSSVGSSSRPFIATWPLTMEQTQSLVYLDLRYAIVSDSLVISLSLNCRRIEFLKVATHWQHYPHSYSVTDHPLACLVAAQQGLKLVHVENHREISQGHELVRTIDTLANLHGPTLETLVLKSHDFQNCNLAGLGKACQKLVKFSAPGGMHLFREEVTKMTEACKLTLEHLDFSNSDIETDCLMSIMRGTSKPDAAKGVLKALILLGMEDTLNQETCLAIGEHGSGLDCFRLDILESEAKDVGLMLSRPCGLNLRVLTLGCHEVHGDLANEILEQIARNCRNVELLDVNHWQFSAKAIENVLRECRMLRYLNVSHTDIGESTADLMCRCLGEVKKEFTIPSGCPLLEDSLLTPLPASAFSASQMQTPAPSESDEGAILEHTPMQEDDDDEEETFEDALADFEHNEFALESAEAQDEVAEIPDEERPDFLRKRGAETRIKDGEDIDEEYMDDTNMDNEDQDVPVYAVNGAGGGGGGVTKQSQLGLIHHHANVMDLRTIMNLDLDEAIEMDLSMSIEEDTGMDLDMCLDLQRYHRNSSYKGDDEEEDEDEGLEDEIEEDEEEDVLMEENNEDLSDDERRVRSKEPKGKEVYVDRTDDAYDQDNVSTIFTTLAPVYSSSYGSTSSASSSSSSSSSTSTTKSSQCGQVLLLAAETSSFMCTPLLPPLPIPSRQEDDGASDLMAVSTSTSVSLIPVRVLQDLTVAPEQLKVSSDVDTSDQFSIFESHTTPSNLTIDTALTDNTSETPSSPSSTSFVAGGSDETPALAPISTSETDSESDALSYAWTLESRLEHVNVECCSHLTLATMTKLKSLALERQASLARQGRKKSRIWVENEHDMMMTRLAMERGPELPARFETSVVDVGEGSLSESFNGGNDSHGPSSTTESQGGPVLVEGSMELSYEEQLLEDEEVDAAALHLLQMQQEPLGSLLVAEDETMTQAATVEVIA